MYMYVNHFNALNCCCADCQNRTSCTRLLMLIHDTERYIYLVRDDVCVMSD